MDFSTTYQFSYQERRPIIPNARQSENKVLHIVYPLLAKIEGTMNAPALVQQFAHLVHPDHSYHLSYLLRQFTDKTGKIHNRKHTKHKRKNNEQTDSMCDKNFSLFGKVMVHCDPLRSNCLLCSVEAVSRCCRPIGSLANSLRAPTCTLKVVASSLSSTPTSGWSKIYSCSGFIKLKLKPHPYRFEERLLPPLLLMSQPAIIQVCPTSYRPRATVAAFRVSPTPYRPPAVDHIATARVAK